MIKVLASTTSIADLEMLINKYFYSKGYYIKDMTIKHISDHEVDYHYSVRLSRGRYQFIYNSKDRSVKNDR